MFKLSAADLHAALTPAVEASNSLDFATPTGVPQLSWKGDAAAVAADLLSEHFEAAPSDPVAGLRGDEPVDYPSDAADSDEPEDTLTRLDALQQKRNPGRRR